MSTNNEITLKCTFCGKTSSNTRTLIQAKEGQCICSECVDRCNKLLGNHLNQSSEDKEKVTDIDLENIPTPHELKAHLDDYVIGQDDAKKVLSVGVYDH